MEYFTFTIRIPKPARAWIRFSLRATMVALTVICVAIAYYVREQNHRREQASVNGKYSHLMSSIRVPEDKASYGLFRDFGYWSGTNYGGHRQLPPGYWVYVAPTWYIWRDSDQSPSSNLDPSVSGDESQSANIDASSYGGSPQARSDVPAGALDGLTAPEFGTGEFEGAF